MVGLDGFIGFGYYGYVSCAFWGDGMGVFGLFISFGVFGMIK